MFLSELSPAQLLWCSKKKRPVSKEEAFKQPGLTSDCELADLNSDILKCYLTNWNNLSWIILDQFYFNNIYQSWFATLYMRY